MTSPPQDLLRDVYWSCDAARWPDRAAFATALQRYRSRIAPDDPAWDKDARVIEHPTLRLCFRCWDKDDNDIEPVLTITSADGAGFTALELLHQLVDGIAAYLVEHNCKLHNYCFFEGLSLGRATDPPLYFVTFGS